MAENGGAIAGATGSSYTTPATVSTDNGASFTVLVSNAAGSMTSSAATLTLMPATSSTAAAGTDVVTYKYDVMRTGQNPRRVDSDALQRGSASFGKLRNLMVDGLVDAQPLYLSKLTVAGATHNVVFVATEHDSVYAFDADTGTILWKVSLLGAGETTSDDRGCSQVTPEIGITSTPVIDRNAGAHGTIFVVAMTKDAASNYHQRLHALDVTTGQETAAGPTEIAATFGATTFAPGQYKERAALLLNNGTIYTTWASHCDDGPYGGWIIALSESTLAITSALNVAMGASGSGYASQGPSIWMSGGGPAADAAGNVYVLTANGRFETTLNAADSPNGGDYGNSFVKISSSGGTLAVADYFTMSGEVAESTDDVDLGSGGVMLLPDHDRRQRHGAASGRRSGQGRQHVRRQSRQHGQVQPRWEQHLAGARRESWERRLVDARLFQLEHLLWPARRLVEGVLGHSTRCSRAAPDLAELPRSSPIPEPSRSSRRMARRTRIVWAYENTSPAVLHAYTADNLAKELYNSNQASNTRDHFGAGNKYIAPVVADGKVFVATTNSVAVFGLLP